LMKAYALAGDRPNALAQYELCREQLWQELAVEPASETVALYDAIKTGKYGPVLSEKSIQPPEKTRHNLPAETVLFIGREQELSLLINALTQEDRRLVTILGPGGMGKTRLALEVGRQLLDQFTDGVYFVDLAPASHPEEILFAVAAALNYEAPDPAQDLKPQLLATLSQRHLLLILDNFEHLLSGGILMNEILQLCPQVSLLVTSRQRLNLVSESRFDLGGLAFDEGLIPETALTYPAVQLFVDSGQRVQPLFSLTDDNVPPMIQICQQVQGMPLGLILAANWLELLTPAEIAAENENSLDFLAAEMSDLPERQRSMQAVFERSWRMLSKDERRVMAALSVFRGGFNREAAEQIANANLHLLLGLVNKSFLQRQPDSGRYNIHELLRQFAAQKRQQTDNADEVLLAHCRYFARLVAREWRRALFFMPEHLARQYAADRDNIHRAWDYALEHGLANKLADLVRGVLAFGDIQGVQGGYLPEQAIRALRQRGVPGDDQAMLQLRLVELGYRVGKDENTLIRQDLLEFLPLLEKKGDLELLYWAYERLKSISLDYLDRDSDAFEWLDKENEVARQMGDEVFIKMTEVHTLWMLYLKGLPAESPLERLQELLSFFEKDYADSFIFYGILNALSEYYSIDESYERAIHYGQLALNLAKGWQKLFWIGFAASSLTRIHLKMGQPSQACRATLETIDWHLAIGQVWQTLGAIWGMVLYFPQLLEPGFNVSLLSMVYHHPEAIPYYRQRIDEARQQFESAIGVDDFAAAWEIGRALDFETAVEQLRAVLSGEIVQEAG
jgi:predicted ATPase